MLRAITARLFRCAGVSPTNMCCGILRNFKNPKCLEERTSLRCEIKPLAIGQFMYSLFTGGSVNILSTRVVNVYVLRHALCVGFVSYLADSRAAGIVLYLH